jgi:hypothetical protein
MTKKGVDLQQLEYIIRVDGCDHHTRGGSKRIYARTEKPPNYEFSAAIASPPGSGGQFTGNSRLCGKRSVRGF